MSLSSLWCAFWMLAAYSDGEAIVVGIYIMAIAALFQAVRHGLPAAGKPLTFSADGLSGAAMSPAAIGVSVRRVAPSGTDLRGAVPGHTPGARTSAVTSAASGAANPAKYSPPSQSSPPPASLKASRLCSSRRLTFSGEPPPPSSAKEEDSRPTSGLVLQSFKRVGTVYAMRTSASVGRLASFGAGQQPMSLQEHEVSFVIKFRSGEVAFSAHLRG